MRNTSELRSFGIEIVFLGILAVLLMQVQSAAVLAAGDDQTLTNASFQTSVQGKQVTF